jgi:hypothetical protein
LQKEVGEALKKRPDYFLKALPAICRFFLKASSYRPIVEDHRSHLRDEVGIVPLRRAPAAAAAPRRLQLIA